MVLIGSISFLERHRNSKRCVPSNKSVLWNILDTNESVLWNIPDTFIMTYLQGAGFIFNFITQGSF